MANEHLSLTKPGTVALKRCALCERPALQRRRLCKEHDRERRIALFGLCPSCGLDPIWSNGQCNNCDRRTRRNREFKENFPGNPANGDDFVRIVTRVIDRLVEMLTEHHVKFEHALQTGKGLGDDPHIEIILEYMWLAHELQGNQYNYVVRRVNERLGGLYALREEYARKEVPNVTTAPPQTDKPGRTRASGETSGITAR